MCAMNEKALGMEYLEKEEFDNTLILLLKKITECKTFESPFIDKFLVYIKNALSSGHHNMPELLKWLSETFQSWKESSPNIAEAIFICQLVEIISKNEQGFHQLQRINVLNELCSIKKHLLIEKRSLNLPYIKLLSGILSHNSGYQWIKTSLQWKLVCSLYFSNSNLYVEREASEIIRNCRKSPERPKNLIFVKKLSQSLKESEKAGFHLLSKANVIYTDTNNNNQNKLFQYGKHGRNFLKNFINKATINNELFEEIFEEIFSPIINYSETNILDKNFCSYTLLLINLLESILQVNIFNENDSFCLKLLEVFDFQMFLNFLLLNSKDESILVAASTLQILFFVAKHKNKKELLLSVDIPLILDTFYTMVKQNQFSGIIKLSKYCQILWNKMELEMKCENKCGVTFIILQLLPVVSFINPPDTAIFDLYIQKVFALVTNGAQKLCYIVRDEIRSQISSKPKDSLRFALKAVLSVTANTECLNFEEAVIIFQAMAYTLKAFIENICRGESNGDDKFAKQRLFCIQDSQLLSAVLNILCVFIQKFKINWPKALESLCLLTLSCVLLKNSDLSSIVVVQAFLLIKLTILNFMSPDLALLLNNTKNPELDFLLPLLHKHMHDPKWEIRDSCLEVVTAIAELSETKYPAFQRALLEKNLYSLVVDIMEGDSESYVRASAIQALTAMTKIEMLNQLLFKMELPCKIIKLLQSESEGIVRREAALLIKQIYLTLNDSQGEILSSIYEIMCYLAICDLHWEVKVNSLIFWEAVIQRTMADQGMIDGSFPKVTFSKENKKIVNLTEDEVKLRLEKVLIKLSKIGCLHVLLSTLNDDCDIQVVEKSAQVLSDLKKILKNYGVMESNSVFPEKTSVKRKNTIFDKCEKKKTFNLNEENKKISNEETSGSFKFNKSCDSDAVIDGIVNETDINLLANVYAQNEEKVSMQKKTLLEEVEPKTFISEIQDLNLEKFIEDKQQWLHFMETDLKSFINKTATVNFIDETNIMDCY